MDPDGCLEVFDEFSVPDERPEWCRDYVLMDYSVADAPPTTVRVPAPYATATMTISDGAGRRVTSWKTLRDTVRYGDSPVYVQMRHHLSGGTSVELCGLERRHSAADRERALRGRELFHGSRDDPRDWQVRRRAGGPDELSPEWLHRRLCRARRYVVTTLKHEPDYAELGAEIDRDARTVQRWIKRVKKAGYEFPPAEEILSVVVPHDDTPQA